MTYIKSEYDVIVEYRLVGLVSHVGSSCACGHYVAHLLRSLLPAQTQTGSAGAGSVGAEGRVPLWVQYNDEKVVRSAAPPTQLAYIYLFARIHS